ncbi:hypothetical protein, partial [Mycobacterium sp. MUNTM1]
MTLSGRVIGAYGGIGGANRVSGCSATNNRELTRKRITTAPAPAAQILKPNCDNQIQDNRVSGWRTAPLAGGLARPTR